MSRRRLPGPFVSTIPYINGVRLKEELEWVRSLRHKIVHEGLRIDSRGHTLRAIETMTWLFDWFNDVRFTNHSNYELYCAMRGNVRFPWKYTSDGIRICDLPAPTTFDDGTIVTTDDISARVFGELLEPSESDLDLFVRMAFAFLDVDLADAPAERKDEPLLRERYRTWCDGIPQIIFCLSLDALPSADLVDAIAATSTATSKEMSQPCRALAVIHHEQHLPTLRRKLEAAIIKSVTDAARKREITIVTAIELRQLVTGVVDGLWAKEAAIKLFLVPGRPATPPPGFRSVGSVRKFYDRASVLSVQLENGCCMRVGESFFTESHHSCRPETITSMQIDCQSVDEAIGPATVGIATSSPKSAFVKGRCVYVGLANSAGEIAGVENQPI